MSKPYNRHPGKKYNEEKGKVEKVTPYDDAQRVLSKGYQVEQLKPAMDLVNEDLLNDLFNQWVETKYHEQQRREFLYQQAVALGAVQNNIERSITAKKNKQMEIDNGPR